MIKYCKTKWAKNKDKLEEELRKRTDLNDCSYSILVKLVVELILNEGEVFECDRWDLDHISEIDNGDYQGTLLYLIPKCSYQPSEYEYLITFVNYGSCSGCDTLMGIQDWGEHVHLTEAQVKDFMVLCKDIVANMILPYNIGWRYNDEFSTVEEDKS